MTSKTCLEDCIVETQRRRSRQFFSVGHHHYDDDDDDTYDNNTDDDDDGRLKKSKQNSPSIIIPAIHERIPSLYKALPASHPCNDLLRELVLDLKDPLEGDEQKIITSSSTTTTTTMTTQNDTSFGSLLQRLRKVTKAHRIHTTLLTRSTLQTNPRVLNGESMSSSASATTSSRTLMATVLLEEYIGDVLCAYYLMGNSISGMVEGGPTFQEWSEYLSNQLLAFLPDDDEEDPILQHLKRLRSPQQHSLSANVWYSIWIYLHSALLRTFPFTMEQHENLGLHHHNYSPTDGQRETNEEDYIRPAKPFCNGPDCRRRRSNKDDDDVGGGRKMYMIPVLRNLRAYVSRYPSTTAHHNSTLSHFGPLGPAFRGRDDIRVLSMDPIALADRLHHSLLTSSRALPPNSGMGLAWLGGYDRVIRWMLELKRESSRRRPMTVMPPVVKLEPPYD